MPVEVEAVGIFGSDVHIYAGHIDWNIDTAGREVPLSASPQILGHGIVGRITGFGCDVHGISVGAAMTEPLGCILHSLGLIDVLGGRHSFSSIDPARKVRSVALAGLGPGGQLFGQAPRGILRYQGPIVGSDPDPLKRARAHEEFGAIVVDPPDLGSGNNLKGVLIRDV